MIEAKDGREGSRVQIFGRHQIKLTAAQLCERKRQVQLKVPSGLPSSLPFPSPLSLSRLSLYRNHSESSADFPPNFPFWKVYTRLTPRQGRQKHCENCPKIFVELLPSAGQINIQLLGGSLCGQLESCLSAEGRRKGSRNSLFSFAD